MTGDAGAAVPGGAALIEADQGGWAPRLVANAPDAPEESHKRVTCPHDDGAGHGVTLVVGHPIVLSSPAVSLRASIRLRVCQRRRIASTSISMG